jgi:hypothetical protein
MIYFYFLMKKCFDLGIIELTFLVIGFMCTVNWPQAVVIFTNDLVAQSFEGSWLSIERGIPEKFMFSVRDPRLTAWIQPEQDKFTKLI